MLYVITQYVIMEDVVMAPYKSYMTPYKSYMALHKKQLEYGIT